MKSLITKLIQTLLLVAAMILASEIILAAVLYLSGTVDSRKVSDIVKVLQGALASPDKAPVEETPVVLSPIEIRSQEELENAVADWERARIAQEDALASEKEALQSMARELEAVRSELDAREKDVEKRTAAFETAKAAQEAAARDQGFLDAVATYNAMKPRDVAELLYGLDDTTTVRYLRAFKTDVRAAVLTEIKKLDDQNQPGRPADVLNRAARLQELLSGGEAVTTAAAAVVAQ